ncbi:hypothetical protein JYP52_02535 [Nitratireductor aquibiodomus]|uniref:hypothetical protein n=1 Tax=Nitratireductor aquibiodomus TaxID=204799 RepID=UPI0019D3CCFF|nr:hypothetical protein [Nitratireductor aquibiodomus]MBN7759999.1 hypothetical protein [Nitratireductor aquibiodomus]
MANPESKKLAVDVIARIDKLEKGMAKARKATNDNFRAMETRADRFKGKMAGIGKSAFAPFAAGAAAALAPMAAFNKAMNDISAASNLAKAADRVGLATKAYQELAFGFQLAGVEAATFETGMEQFTRRIAEAEAKGGTLAKILEANGIALRTSSGEMRSAESLLADYADLMKNAASEQERMLLATEAFGRGGADFVLALKNGSDGLRDMKRATEEAGGTIDEQLLRKAEVLDDKFAAMWRTFEVNSKVAILTAVTELDGLIGKANEFGNSPFFKWLSKKAGVDDAVFVPGEGIYNPGKDQMSPNARVAQAFQGEMQTADAELLAALKERYKHITGEATATTVPPTVIPGAGGTGGSGGGGMSRSASLERDLELAGRVIENLEHERALIGLNAAERAKANAIRQAGTAISAEQRAEIERLVEAIYAERDAFDAAAEAAAEMGDLGKDAMRGLIDDLIAGKDAGEAFANVLSKIGSKLIDMALGGLFSGGGGIGGGGGLLGGAIIPGILHSGGVAGRDGYGHGRAVSPSVFSGAPRYHNGGVAGLKPNEVPAILQKGEMVIPKGAPSMPKLKKGGDTVQNNYAPTYQIDASQAQNPQETERVVARALKEHDKTSYQRWLADQAQARRRNVV